MMLTMDLKNKLHRAMDLHKAGKLDAAETIYLDVLKHNPDDPNALHLLGIIVAERGNAEKGIDMILQALQKVPNSFAMYHNVGNLYAQSGQLKKAEENFRKAIELNPDYAEAFHNLSSNVKFSKDDPAIGLLRELIKSKDLSVVDSCFAYFALGKMLNDIGEYDEAFLAYEKGNQFKKAEFPRQEHLQIVENILQCYTPNLFQQLEGCGDPSETPVFIVGMPRTGTTLVEQIIASHPQGFGAGELGDITSIAGSLTNFSSNNSLYPFCLAGLNEEVFTGFARTYLQKQEALAPAAKRIVDKHPLNFQYVGLIHLMFPNARIIHTLRHPLDTCLSCYFQNFSRGQEYSFDIKSLTTFYHSYRKIMAFWEKLLPGRVFSIRYEDVVNDPEYWAHQLIEHIGLEWDDACLQPHASDRHVRTASTWQVRQPIYKTSVYRYRKYEKHLGELKALLGDVIEEYEGD